MIARVRGLLFLRLLFVLIAVSLGAVSGSSGIDGVDISVQAAAATDFDCTSVQGISETECMALVSLYHATNGDAWFNNTNWLQTNTPCNWYMVICDQGQVVELFLRANNLVGTLPGELGNMTGLVFLDVSSNHITGGVPAKLAQLNNLEELYLACTTVSGDVAGIAQNMPLLTYLDISSTDIDVVSLAASDAEDDWLGLDTPCAVAPPVETPVTPPDNDGDGETPAPVETPVPPDNDGDGETPAPVETPVPPDNDGDGETPAPVETPVTPPDDTEDTGDGTPPDTAPALPDSGLLDEPDPVIFDVALFIPFAGTGASGGPATTPDSDANDHGPSHHQLYLPIATMAR